MGCLEQIWWFHKIIRDPDSSVHDFLIPRRGPRQLLEYYLSQASSRLKDGGMTQEDKKGMVAPSRNPPGGPIVYFQLART